MEGVQNEAGVRYTFGNLIIDMLCRYFGYRLTLKESDPSGGDVLNTSTGSRYDYVCWRLMCRSEDNEDIFTPTVVLETKHEQTLQLKAAAQVISYYSQAKQVDIF